MGMDDFVAGLMIFFWALIIISLVSMAYFVIVYIFQGIGLYRMAKNTGNKYAWCAWLPVGHQFLVGNLADRYNMTRNKKTHYGPLLLGFSAVATLGTWFISAGMINLLDDLSGYYYYYDEGLTLLYSFFALVIHGVAIANLVLYCVASYNMYLDYEPSSATGYTVLAVFQLDWIAKFICRNNVPVGAAGRVYPKQPKYGQQPAAAMGQQAWAPPGQPWGQPNQTWKQPMNQPPMYYNNTPPQAPPNYQQGWGQAPGYPPQGNHGMNMPPVPPPQNGAPPAGGYTAEAEKDERWPRA